MVEKVIEEKILEMLNNKECVASYDAAYLAKSLSPFIDLQKLFSNEMKKENNKND